MKRSLPSIITGALLIVILGLYMITYQVQYNQCAIVRTFGKIVPPGLLFSVPSESVQALNEAGQVPESVRKAFSENELPLNANATWDIKQESKEWKIVDDQRTWIVRRDAGQLQVFDPEVRESESVIMDPGLYWKWPWPVQRVTHYDNRVQITTTPGEELPTQDGKNIILTTTIGWRIHDPYWFSVSCTNREAAENNLKSQVRDKQKSVIGNYLFANLISTDKEELKYDQIERQILEAVKPSARDLYGIDVESVKISKLTLPKGITQTVFEAMKKERQTVAARYTSEGESGAQKIKDEAESIASTILAFADRKAAEIVAAGQARAAEYNRVLEQDQELAQFLLKLRYLPDILKKRSTIFFEHEPPFDILMETEENGNRAETKASAAPQPEPSVVEGQ